MAGLTGLLLWAGVRGSGGAPRELAVRSEVKPVTGQQVELPLPPTAASAIPIQVQASATAAPTPALPVEERDARLEAEGAALEPGGSIAREARPTRAEDLAVRLGWPAGGAKAAALERWLGQRADRSEASLVTWFGRLDAEVLARELVLDGTLDATAER
jgi:hypothetical protein